MKNKIIIPGIFLLSLLSMYFLHRYHQQNNLNILTNYKSHISNYKKNDQHLYLSLPIYQDYINAKKQKKLRKHLLADHLKTADSLGKKPIRDQKHLQDLLKKGEMVELKQDFSTPWYFFNVRKEYRYLSPNAKKGLIKLSQHFNKKIKDRMIKKFGKKANTDFIIKFAISSATRSESYQRKLRGRNANAASISSHSYGISFDIFYDEYYLYREISESSPSWPYLKEGKSLIGFAIGRARRRQLRAMLAETLIDLQDEGVLYAIWERNQRCYHVTILEQ